MLHPPRPPTRAVPRRPAGSAPSPHGQTAPPARNGWRDAPTRLLRVVALATALAYVLVGLATMLFASPTVPFADSYRFLATFLAQPFPANVLAADNGHREVLTNLVRLLDLELCAAGQELQIACGVLGITVAAALLLRPWRGAPTDARIAATALVAVGMFWLGNGRKLAHGSESAHLGLVLLCLVVGLRCVVSSAPTRGGRRAWLAAGLGVAATLSFSSGLACFVAFAVVLLLRHAPPGHWLPVVVGAAVAAALLLFGDRGGPPALQFAPLAQLEQWLRWLGAPFVHVLHPLLDPEHAARMPWPASAPARTVAALAHPCFGPAASARWPALALGALGLLALVAFSRRLWRDGGSTTERVAVGVAWFGAAVGVLVVAARFGYFVKHADQITTTRYLPWSMLLWTGLALAFVSDPKRAPRTRLLAALLAAGCFAPSQVWCGRAAWRLREIADTTAAGAAVGVLGVDFELSETRFKDVARAIPALRAAHAAMFAWPETGLLGTVPEAARLQPIDCRDVAVEPVANRFDSPGSVVTFAAESAPGRRLLLLDGDGCVRGIAVPAGCAGRWHGWLRGALPARDLCIAALRGGAAHATGAR